MIGKASETPAGRNVMKTKIASRYHLTATQKRHIRAMIERGLTTARSRLLSYTLSLTDSTAGARKWSGVASRRYRDDWGRPQVEREVFTVEEVPTAPKPAPANDADRQRVNDYVDNEIYAWEMLHGLMSSEARAGWEDYRAKELARIDARG